MKRNAKYIMGKIIDEHQLAKPAQVGVDITVDSIAKIHGGASISDITIHGRVEVLAPQEFKDESNPFVPIEIEAWMLEPGVYAVKFDQGLNGLAADENASIVQRSSLNRNGVRVQGSIYDPGYGCAALGATLYAAVPIVIHRHARIAQLIIETNEPVEEKELYNGQYQGEDK